MKKLSLILAAFLTFSTSFTAVSCGSDNNAAETDIDIAQIVNEAIENTGNANFTTLQMQMNIVMDMESSGMKFSMEMPTTIDMKIDMTNKEIPKFDMSMVMDMGQMYGGTIEQRMICDGEWVYTSSMGEEYKASVDSEYADLESANATDGMIKGLPEELLKKSEYTKNDDGSYTVKVAVDANEFSSIYDDFIASQAANQGALPEDIEISDTSVEITVKDGYLCQYDMAFTMTMEVMGVPVVAKVDVSAVYTDIGKEFTITLPEGFEDFPDIEDMEYEYEYEDDVNYEIDLDLEDEDFDYDAALAELEAALAAFDTSADA